MEKQVIGVLHVSGDKIALTSTAPGPSRSKTLKRRWPGALLLPPPPLEDPGGVSGSFFPPSTVTLRVRRAPDMLQLLSPTNQMRTQQTGRSCLTAMLKLGNLALPPKHQNEDGRSKLVPRPSLCSSLTMAPVKDIAWTRLMNRNHKSLGEFPVEVESCSHNYDSHRKMNDNLLESEECDVRLLSDRLQISRVHVSNWLFSLNVWWSFHCPQLTSRFTLVLKKKQTKKQNSSVSISTVPQHYVSLLCSEYIDFGVECSGTSCKPLPRPKHTISIPYFRLCDCGESATANGIYGNLQRTGLRDAPNNVRVFLRYAMSKARRYS